MLWFWSLNIICWCSLISCVYCRPNCHAACDIHRPLLSKSIVHDCSQMLSTRGGIHGDYWREGKTARWELLDTDKGDWFVNRCHALMSNHNVIHTVLWPKKDCRESFLHCDDSVAMNTWICNVYGVYWSNLIFYLLNLWILYISTQRYV